MKIYIKKVKEPRKDGIHRLSFMIGHTHMVAIAWAGLSGEWWLHTDNVHYRHIFSLGSFKYQDMCGIGVILLGLNINLEWLVKDAIPPTA